MESKSKKSIVPVFLFFMLLLLGWLTYSVIGITKVMQTKSWPTTRGTVISSTIKKGTSSKGSPKYSPQITYSYNIGSVIYHSNRYSSTIARGSSDWAKQILSQYPDNEMITVYYNSKNPKESVLDTRLQSDNYWMFFSSLFFLLVVMLAFIQQLKNKKAKLSDDEIIWQERTK
jgi:hypothetical protein